MQDTPVRPHTTASCFATYLLPHVLFVADFEERERIAKVCSLAWNIGLFPDADDRERHVEQILALFFDGEAAPPPPGVRQGYGEELTMLADLKRDLFPWQFANVMHAGLGPGPGPDTLVVDADGTVERIELALNPSIMALPAAGRPARLSPDAGDLVLSVARTGDEGRHRPVLVGGGRDRGRHESRAGHPRRSTGHPPIEVAKAKPGRGAGQHVMNRIATC